MNSTTDRVVRLLNMLASANEQERATTGAKLAAMARESEKTVAEFVRTQLSFTAWTVGPPEHPQGSSTKLSEWETSDLLVELDIGIRHAGFHVLSEWERHFTNDILRRNPTKISKRQSDIIRRVIKKVSK